MRLDVALVEGELAKSRSFAKTLIEEGFVSVNGKACKKPALDVSEFDTVVVTGTPYTYVGRGGVKLQGALEAFGIDVNGTVCVDIGASTGGFTDCLLQRGASRVFAVDSGTGQLDEKLRRDSRVVNLENFNARKLSLRDIGERCDIAVTDVSFISQTLIIPVLSSILKDNGLFVSLIKPQFECGRTGLSKGGIVKDKKVIFNSIEKVILCAGENNLGVLGLINSPVLGGDGNREFLMLGKIGEKRTVFENEIREVCGL